MRFSFRNLFKKARNDEKGTVTVEFIIMFPLLFTWMIGSLVYFDAFRERNNASKAASSVADIISRTDVQNVASVSQLALLQERLLPGIQGTKSLRVSSIQRVTEDSFIVLWSYSPTGSDALLAVDIPINILPLMTDNETVILTETAVPFVPLSGLAGIAAQTYINKIAIRPRYVSAIAWDSGS
ncbi:MAG: hypothetical protein JKY31_03005 [Rhodobacteraceae bacterium]|nr:hypothetical protein [Paracoccaceae bacterium]